MTTTCKISLWIEQIRYHRLSTFTMRCLVHYVRQQLGTSKSTFAFLCSVISIAHTQSSWQAFFKADAGHSKESCSSFLDIISRHPSFCMSLLRAFERFHLFVKRHHSNPFWRVQWFARWRQEKAVGLFGGVLVKMLLRSTKMTFQNLLFSSVS